MKFYFENRRSLNVTLYTSAGTRKLLSFRCTLNTGTSALLSVKSKKNACNILNGIFTGFMEETLLANAGFGAIRLLEHERTKTRRANSEPRRVADKSHPPSID